MKRDFPNIEKSAFRKGEYVGYGGGKVWKISRGIKGWNATAQDGSDHFHFATLVEISANLKAMRERTFDNALDRIVKKNPRRKSKRAKRNPIPAALAVLKAAEAAAYHGMRRNPTQREAKRMRRTGRKLYGKTFAAPKMKTAIGSRRKQIKTARRVLKAKGYRVNPATKHIHLQEKRGTAWVTLALFPLSQKAVAVKIAKQWHRKHPGKTIRLFS